MQTLASLILQLGKVFTRWKLNVANVALEQLTGWRSKNLQKEN